MKTTFAVTLCFLLLLFSACAQKVNDQADVQAIKNSCENYLKAINAKDAGAVAALMTEKTVFADVNLPVVFGKEAIQKLHQSFFDQVDAQATLPVLDVQVIGDLGVARGTWNQKITPKMAGVAPETMSGSWTVVFKRQGDGAWKWDSLVANSDQPPTGSTATGEDEKALYQLERDWAAANLKRDTAAIDKFLADDFVSNFDGRTRNKKQVLAEIKNNPAKIESGANRDMRVVVLGTTAIVDGVYAVKSTTGGKDTSRQTRWTEVYVKRDGRWQCVTQYAANMPVAP